MVASVDGIPVLLKDRALTEQKIEEAIKLGKAEWYDADQLSQWQGPYRHHLLKRKQYVEQLLATHRQDRTGIRVVGLDLGCGDGSNLGWISRHFSETYASDYNLLRLRRARRAHCHASLFLADIANYPANDESFDVIFFNHVLEHIPDDLGALREVHRILRSGGLCILGVPNEGAAFWQLAYRLQPKSLATTDHVHFYTANSVSKKCREAGFSVREVHRMGWGVPHWTMDAALRKWKCVDDFLERLGRTLLPGQASSLYLILAK
jgi:ubiquinone/menaquinone biosynthesis C-methylase UbiE